MQFVRLFLYKGNLVMPHLQRSQEIFLFSRILKLVRYLLLQMASFTKYASRKNSKNVDGEYVLLSDLNSSKDDWKIKVRVSRLWNTLNFKRKMELISMDMVLIDEKCNYIHATIPRKFVHLFRRLIKEGQIYTFEDFSVTSNKEKFAVVEKNSLMIQFFAATNVQQIEVPDVTIPYYIFEFVGFGELQSRCGREVLTDLIGVVVGVTPRDQRAVDEGKVPRMVVHLQEASGKKIDITIWDDYIGVFEEEMQKNSADVNVVVISSTSLNEFRGTVYAATSRSSRIYVNLEIAEATSLKKKFIDLYGVPAITNVSKTLNTPKQDKLKTISEILDIAFSGNALDSNVHCLATINDVLLKNDWKYVSCPQCKKVVIPTETSFWCEKCDKNVEYPTIRFRLELQVKDSTGSIVLVLFDEVAEQLTQIKLSELFPAIVYADAPALPPQVQKVIGTAQIFQIRLNSFFQGRGVHSFTATKLFHPDVLVQVKQESNGAAGGHEKTHDQTPNEDVPFIRTPVPVQKKRRLLRLNKDDDLDEGSRISMDENLFD